MKARSDTSAAYSDAAIMATNTSILWLLPTHGTTAIGQFAAATCSTIATGLFFATARRVERAEGTGR